MTPELCRLSTCRLSSMRASAPPRSPKGSSTSATTSSSRPVGELFLASTERGLCRISYTVEGQDEVVARIFGARVLRSPLDAVRRELDEYFEGRRRDFDLAIDLRVAPFHEAVLHELARVPYGQVDTYGHLAKLVGSPKAARAVGTVMNRNPIPIVLPCHRIIGANGSLTGYGGGLDVKRRLLELEGATLEL